MPREGLGLYNQIQIVLVESTATSGLKIQMGKSLLSKYIVKSPAMAEKTLKPYLDGKSNHFD